MPERLGIVKFSNNQLTSVIIPNSVTYIGDGAFRFNLLTSFILPTPTITGFVLPEAQKEGYTFDNWNGSIPSNIEVTDLSIAYTANFTLNTGIENVVGFNVMVYPNPANGFNIILLNTNYYDWSTNC